MSSNRLHIRPVSALLAALLLLCASMPAARAQNATTGEVKAAFLYNFARFTEWPAEAFTSESAALVIGVAGDEGLRRTLDNLTRGKLAGMRRLRTRNVKDATDTADLHIVYIGGVPAAQAQELIKSVGSFPVLTVGDADRFCEYGGMINFLIAGNRVRFEVRFDVLDQARLKVSSRVLTLAKTIHGKS